MQENNLARMGNVFLIEIDKIKPNPHQPRTEFDEEQLRNLAESIRQYGVLQPLVVTRKEIENPGGVIVEYELIAGERRLRASKIAGLSQLPVIIRHESDEKAKLEIAIIENLQREDLNAMDRAKAFKRLTEEFRLKHHEIAARIGKSREYVSNTLRLLGLPAEVQEGLAKNVIGEGHCRTILMLDGRLDDQMRLYREIIGKRMNVRQAERISRGIIRGALDDQAVIQMNQEIKSIEKKLSNELGTKVHIELNGRRGKISIDFFSNEELKAFINKVTSGKTADEEKENEKLPETNAPEEQLPPKTQIKENDLDESPLETAFQQQARD